MRIGALATSAIFSGLALIMSAFAQSLVDDAGALFSEYILLFGVVYVVLMGLNIFIDHTIHQYTGKSSKVSKIFTVTMFLLFILSMISAYVEIPEGVYSIIGSLLFVMIFYILMEIMVYWGIKHSGSASDWVLRGTGRRGRKELKYMREEQAVEKKERETIYKVIVFLKKHGPVRDSINTAIQDSQKGSSFDLIEYLKEMYIKSKQEGTETEMKEKIQAAEVLLREAMGTAEATHQEEITGSAAIVRKEMRKMGSSIIKEGEAIIKEKLEEEHVIASVIHIVIELIKRTEEHIKTVGEDQKKAYKEELKELVQFEKNMKTLLKELDLEIKDLKIEEQLVKKSQRRGTKKKEVKDGKGEAIKAEKEATKKIGKTGSTVTT